MKAVDRDHPLLQEAWRLWLAHERDAALEVYERALRADPTNVRIVVNAARAFGLHHHARRARELCARLVHLAPGSPDTHHLIGETLRLFDLTTEAIAAFHEANRLGSTRPNTRLELAALLERAGKLDEAWAMLEGIAHPWAELTRARIERRRWVDPIPRLSSLVGSLPEHDELWREALGDLALAHDRAGNLESAVETIGRCKSSQRRDERGSLEPARHVERRLLSLTSEPLLLEPAADVTDPRLTLLAGFPRSGTTLLERMLDAHPSIVGVEERDILAGFVFPMLAHRSERAAADVLSSLSMQQRKQGHKQYVRALEEWINEPIGNRTVLDKNPGATAMIPLLATIAPGSAVILAVRDPRDVVLSCYLRYLRLNPVSVCFLDIERTARRYDLDMRIWLAQRDALPIRSVQVRYEDVIADMQREVSRVLDVLGLEFDPSILAYRSQSNIVHSPSYAEVARPIYRDAVGRWERYADLLAPAMPILDRWVREFGY